MTNLEVANTILSQLGGRRFVAMTGAKNLTAGSQGLGSLTLKLNQNMTKDRVSHVRVTLTPADVYSVEFIRVRGAKVTTVRTVEDVYCDMLQDCFLENTGLFTHL